MIDILLATHNGARFLPELLRSLEVQTCQAWQLIVRDDGSSDDSLDIVRHWAKRAQRTCVIRDGGGSLGAAASFATLLRCSDAPYFMLCDQDDVWLPGKIARLLEAIQSAEARRGDDTPILAHSDLVVVGNDLEQVHPSLWQYQRLMKPLPDHPYTRLAFHNCVTGCASIGNAALRAAALPIPHEAMMHDWWLALVAGTFGEIVELTEPTVLYRQHGNNTLGAKSRRLSLALRRLIDDPAAFAQRMRMIIGGTQRQAKAFSERFAERLEPNAAAFFREYGSLNEGSFLKRKSFPFRYRVWPGDVLANGSLLAFI